jgi:DNA-binding GntR family transcriptional regulator
MSAVGLAGMEAGCPSPLAGPAGAFALDSAARADGVEAGSRRANESQRDLIVREIVNGLYEGRYEPGERLLEVDLTNRYGASRGPVREALNRLSALGVIELIPQRGALVRRLTLGEALDIQVVVQALVGVSARLAAQRIDEACNRDRLQAALAHLVQFDSADGSAAYARAREMFYGVVTAVAGNAELGRIMPGTQTHLIRVQFRAALRNADRRRQKDYRDIVDAILARNAAAAERAARFHIGRSIQALEAYRAG